MNSLTHKTCANRIAYAFAKRALDIAFCVLALPVVAPVMAVIAVVIKISSPGPVFYRGVRTGRDGVPFRIFKFRTMVVDAELLGGGTTGLNDPRVFPSGRWIRRYKLDELPQVFNVIAGDMSVVGPRPELAKYTERYTDAERVILSMRPGITDYSSIQFSSLDEVVGSKHADRIFEQVVLPEKNRLRLKYVESCSLYTDVKIILLTLARLLRKVIG